MSKKFAVFAVAGGVGGLVLSNFIASGGKVADSIKTPGIKSIEGRYTSGGGTPNGLSGANTPTGSQRTDPNVVKTKPDASERKKEQAPSNLVSDRERSKEGMGKETR